MTKWPWCECRGNNCPVHGVNYAPAAYVMLRKGVEIKLCTHCNLSDDELVKIIPSKNDDLSEYKKFDLLGYACLLDKLELDVPDDVLAKGLISGLNAIATDTYRVWEEN